MKYNLQVTAHIRRPNTNHLRLKLSETTRPSQQRYHTSYAKQRGTKKRKFLIRQRALSSRLD